MMDYFKLLCMCWVFVFPVELLASQVRLNGFYGSGSEMGEDVQIQGDFAVVSVPGTYGASPKSGLVSTFKKIEGNWIKTENLFPSDGFDGDQFGRRLSLNGRRLAVSAPFDDSMVGENSFSNLGSVFIYELDVDDIWQLTAKILPNDLANNTYFGYNLSLDGDRLIAAAVGGSSTVYVFDLLEGQWQETAKISDPTIQGNATFGRFDVILEDDLAFISTSIENGEDFTGQVNVYQKTGDMWLKQAEIISAENLNNDTFGWSMGYHKGRLAIGADTTENNQGSVYIYELEGTSWIKTKKITLPANGQMVKIGFLGTVLRFQMTNFL